MQRLIVLIIIAFAALFLLRLLLAKRRAFSVKKGCGDDCGCAGPERQKPQA